MRKSVLSGKVISNALHQLKIYRESPSWLNKGIDFNHGLHLVNKEKQLEQIIELCGVYKREENYRNLEILIANLINHGDEIPVVISMNSNDWKLSRYVRAGVGTINLVKNLFDQGFIKMKIGYRTDRDSRKTRIWPTDKLLKIFPNFHQDVIYNPVELVELRNEKGTLIDYKDTENTIRIRNKLEKANSVNQLAKINYKDRVLSAFLVAIFNKKFTLYGRLHTKGYSHYQSLSGVEREEITINGNSTIELDFSGLHPRLLYAKEVIQYDKDPYSIVDERKEVRPFLKHILLCMLNGDAKSVERAANYWLLKNHNEREKLNSLGISSARPYIEAFYKSHEPIKHYFCSGKETGLRIMNLDAQIALEIVDHFANQNIPVLAIHDSFIVEEQYENELRDIMSSTYKKFTGGFTCPIQ